MEIIILGCGGSAGVPAIGGPADKNRADPPGGDWGGDLGGDWGACDPANPKNRRLRSSVLVKASGQRFLIDTTPDLRAQFLTAGIGAVDAVLYTHAHADHLNGIDDLRVVNRVAGKVLPAYGSPETLREISERFGYVFEKPDKDMRFFKPCLNPVPVEAEFHHDSVRIVPFTQDHGTVSSLGYRIGNFAYSVDVKELGEVAFARLAGVHTWVVDCYAYDPHPTHSHLAQTLAWIARVRPRRAVLTHMPQGLDYDAVRALCPPGVEPAYDFMRLDVPG